MKQILWLCVIFGFAAVAAASEWEDFVGSEKVELLNSAEKVPADFFVSLDGNDEWSGRLAEPNADKTDGPFRTFDRARLCVKTYRESPAFDGTPTVVEVRPGLYELDKTLSFDASDSGTAEAPVIWRGTANENGRPAAVLRAGRSLSGAKPVTDESILNRVKPEVREAIRVIDLRGLGIDDYGTLDGTDMAEIFFGDLPLTLSRYPNKDFLYIDEVMSEEGGNPESGEMNNFDDGKFTVREDADFSAWLNEPDPWAFGYWYFDWSTRRQQIRKIVPERKYLELVPVPHTYGFRAGQYFYVYNMLCEVDMPGEYYIDHRTGLLYFYPPEGYQDGHLTMPLIQNVVSVSNTDYLVISGFQFDTCRGTAVTVSGNNVTVCGNLVRNVTGNGIEVNGSQNLVFGNYLYNLGGKGIYLTSGDRGNLIEGKSAAVNNDLRLYGRIYRVYAPGIGFSGCGILVSQNRITDAPHSAVIFGGNENRIEYNEIYDVCTETLDAGAIYCGRDWTQRGNLIKNNYLHNIVGLNGKGCVSVYLDDMFSSADIVGNLFVDDACAIMLGGGRDCSIVNNIFINCQPTMHIDARALGWCHYHADEWIEEEKEKGTLAGIDYKSEIWSKKYPKLRAIMEGEPKAPEGDVVARNIVIKKERSDWRPSPYDGEDAYIEDSARKYLTMEDNIVGDYRLLLSLSGGDDSILPFHFDRIPVEQIGVFEYPASLSR